MTRRDWWLGVVLVTVALLAHALLPRYDWRGTAVELVRIDRWTGVAVRVRASFPSTASPARTLTFRAEDINPATTERSARTTDWTQLLDRRIFFWFVLPILTVLAALYDPNKRRAVVWFWVGALTAAASLIWLAS